MVRYDPYGWYVTRGLPGEISAGQSAGSASLPEGGDSTMTAMS